MNLDDQITRSLARRADQASYDVTPLAAVERGAHGLRRRRRAAAALGVAAVVTAVVLPLALVRSDSDTGTLPPATDPPAQVVTSGPLGYLSKGLYHPSSGADPIPVNVRDVKWVAEVDGGVLVLSDLVSEVDTRRHTRYTRIDPDGDVTDQGCTTGPPGTSPSGETVALATIPCPGDDGPAGILVSHGAATTQISVKGDALPVVLGVDDAGDRVVYLAAPDSRGLRNATENDVVRVIDAGTRSTVPGIHRARGYDPVDEVVFGSLAGTGSFHTYYDSYAGGAVTVDGELLWSHDALEVHDPSPDGRFVVAEDMSELGEGRPPAAEQTSVHPRLLDAATGATVLELPEKTADGGYIFGYRWDDVDHLLAEVYLDDEERFVRIALDGTVTDTLPGLAPDDSDVILESRSPPNPG